MLKGFATSHLLSGGPLTAGSGTPYNVGKRQAAERLLAGSVGLVKNAHHCRIVILVWRMPGKKEINYVAHRYLIGVRGKVKTSLGAASRSDEASPDQKLQDFGCFSG